MSRLSAPSDTHKKSRGGQEFRQTTKHKSSLCRSLARLDCQLCWFARLGSSQPREYDTIKPPSNRVYSRLATTTQCEVTRLIDVSCCVVPSYCNQEKNGYRSMPANCRLQLPRRTLRQTVCLSRQRVGRHAICVRENQAGIIDEIVGSRLVYAVRCYRTSGC